MLSGLLSLSATMGIDCHISSVMNGIKGCNSFKHALHNVNEYVLSGTGCFSALCDTGLRKLDIPVAVNIPDKVEQILVDRNTKLVAVEI